MGEHGRQLLSWLLSKSPVGFMGGWENSPSEGVRRTLEWSGARYFTVAPHQPKMLGTSAWPQGRSGSSFALSGYHPFVDFHFIWSLLFLGPLFLPLLWPHLSGFPPAWPPTSSCSSFSWLDWHQGRRTVTCCLWALDHTAGSSPWSPITSRICAGSSLSDTTGFWWVFFSRVGRNRAHSCGTNSHWDISWRSWDSWLWVHWLVVLLPRDSVGRVILWIYIPPLLSAIM